jgi:hypothetical protein
MANHKSQYGIIGFFDILGYQSFLVNNEDVAGESTEKVLNFIVNLEKNIQSHVRNILKNSKNFKKLVDEIKFLVFSDTILLTTTYARNEGNDRKTDRWILFLVASLKLNRWMFEYGLPLRGVITTGNFRIKEHCFVGKPIIDAYELCHDLDLSACVMTDKSFQEVTNLINSSKRKKIKKLLNASIVKYLIPKKGGKEEKLPTLNLFTLSGLKPKSKKSNVKSKDNKIDIRQFVFNSFWKHNKDIPQEALNKVMNTEQYLRYIIRFTKKQKS